MHSSKYAGVCVLVTRDTGTCCELLGLVSGWPTFDFACHLHVDTAENTVCIVAVGLTVSSDVHVVWCFRKTGETNAKYVLRRTRALTILAAFIGT